MKNLTTAERNQQKHLEDLQRIKEFRLLDDDFMTKCFEGNIECIQLILRIVLDVSDLIVTEVRTQMFVENLLNRSVRLDVVAADSKGTVYNIEIQRMDKGAGKKRARYNSSMMDANFLRKGEDFDSLPETYVIFITENDVIGKGQPVYQVERYFSGTDEPFGDGTHIVYVNGAYRGETPIGRLMHDFSCTDPDDMNYDVLADRVRFFKESKEGVLIMCKAIEDIRRAEREEGIEEGWKKGVKTTALRMLAAGKYALEEIAEITGLPLEDIQKMQIGTNV